MSFATSLNAFGMKPATTNTINTNLGGTNNTAASTSPFGGPKPAGSLFGQQPQQQSQQQQGATGFGGGGFGQQPQQQQQPQQTGGGGLFGQGNTQQQQGGGFFGQNTQQQQQGQQGQQGSLFGQPQQQPQQPAAGGGLFGGQNMQQQGTGGLFGGQQQQQQPAAGGGLFGGQNTQQQQNAFGGGSLFGGSNNTAGNTGAANPGPFGAFGANNQQQQPQQQQQTGLWGAPNPLQAQATMPAGGFGGGGGATAAPGGLFGVKSMQPQQQLGMSSNQPAKPPPFTKSTKFNDLPDDVKRVFEGLDAQIQGRVQISKELHQRKLGDAATQGQELIRNVHKDLVHVTNTTRADLHTTSDLRVRVDQAVEDTIVATRIVDGFKNPQGGAGYLKDHAGFPLEYFTRVAEQMKDRLSWYKSTIEQIERKLASSTTHAQTPQGISSTLQAQHATFIALANKTAAVDAELQKIKALYTQLWRAKTGSVRDPFNELDKNGDGDFGLASLNVR